ncbi:transposase [Nocardia sp. NPDC051750]|uniref:transposase n=1 Tax=Nocardia sp. NPDC051750 TaxID=3364325 RepID=UPI0037AB2495
MVWLLAVVVTAASIQDRDGAHRLLTALQSACSTVTLVFADGGYTGRLVVWAKDILALTFQIIRRSDTSKVFQVRYPTAGSSNAPTDGSSNTAAASVTTNPADHHEAMVYIAMIATLSRRLTRQ